MRLHRFGWMVLVSIALSASPAFATAPAAPAPVVQTASMPSMAPSVPAKGGDVQPAAVTPSEPKTDAAAPALADPATANPSGTPTDPAALPAEAEAKPEPPPITLHVDINLSTQRMTVTSEGDVLHSWAISSGRSGYLTPRGTFRPQWKARMWYSRQYDMSPMPYSVFFNGGVATHGTSATGMLGRPASHGCVRLTTANAKTFYNLVGKHGMESTRIVVRGTTPVAPVARNNSRQYQQEADRRRRIQRGYYASGGYGGYYGSPWW